MAIRDRIHNGIGTSVNDVSFRITLGLGSLRAELQRGGLCATLDIVTRMGGQLDNRARLEGSIDNDTRLGGRLEVSCNG